MNGPLKNIIYLLDKQFENDMQEFYSDNVIMDYMGLLVLFFAFICLFFGSICCLYGL